MKASALPPRDLALVLAVVALWGFNFVPIRWALDEVLDEPQLVRARTN